MAEMTESSSQEAVLRLKELLFDREARELDTLTRSLAEVTMRAGSDVQFQQAVARVLDSAVRDAEVSRHRELADAMSPMVLRALRAEMRSGEMQDQIAGVMYPRMGEMVKRYVSSAIRDMMQQINRRLEAGLVHNRFFLWIRSITSGRSMAELALAATQQLEVQEIYLVQRGSGVLIHHWRRGGSEGAVRGENRGTLVSGFLAAITALAEEAFEADKESLRTLDLDNNRIYLRGSPDYLLAAMCKGSAPAGIDGTLDAELIRVLGENQQIERAETPGSSPAASAASRNALLEDFSANVEQAARQRTDEASRRHGTRTLKVLLWLIGLPLAALAGWYFYVSFMTYTLQSKADSAIAAIPKLKGYPVKAHVERGGRQIWVAGLAPDETTRRQVLGAMKQIAPEATLSEAVGVLPNADVRAHLAEEGLRRAVERAERRLTTLVTDMAAARERLQAAEDTTALAETEIAAKGALEELRAVRQGSPGDQLDDGLKRAYDALSAAAGKLAVLAGSKEAPPLSRPDDATEGADALVLLGERIANLITAIEQRESVAPIARRIDDVGATAAARAAEVDRQAEQRLAELDKLYRARIDELERKLNAHQPTPRQRLEAFVRSHAIFFSNDEQYRDEAASRATLDTLAQLLRGNDLVVRVVGYTDEVGSATRNSPLSQARADRVVGDLISRGVPRSRLIAVGRLNVAPIASGGGVESPNRRAEFELAFDGEKGSGP